MKHRGIVAAAILSAACGDPRKPPESREAPKPASAPADPAEAPAEPPFALSIPKGLVAPPVPADNPLSAAKVDLGHRLFFDKRLSVDGSRSCYSCHQNELGNADGRATALGAGDKPLPRNSPTIWNVAYAQALYWDGRAPTLEAQMIGAWKGGNMGVGEEGIAAKATLLASLPEYAGAFREAFGLGAAEEVRPEHVAAAIASYERSLLCGDTAYDREELDGEAAKGWRLFGGKAGCIACHGGAMLADGKYHNVGIGAGGEDRGRGAITKDPADNYKFRTPTLRNVGRTAPYFHDGSVDTLEEAVRLMAQGGPGKVPGIDPLLRDTRLSSEEVRQIVAFLEALSCPGELEVIGEQRVAGIGL